MENTQVFQPDPGAAINRVADALTDIAKALDYIATTLAYKLPVEVTLITPTYTSPELRLKGEIVLHHGRGNGPLEVKISST